MDYHLDAKNQKLGRLSAEIATILQGKKSPHYEPRLLGSDRVLLQNYRHFSITGKKLTGKIYYSHSGRPGHLKSKTLEEAIKKDPRWVLKEAVRKMLPKNKLNSRRLKNLIFID